MPVDWRAQGTLYVLHGPPSNSRPARGQGDSHSLQGNGKSRKPMLRNQLQSSELVVLRPDKRFFVLITANIGTGCLHALTLFRI